jgi:hypothetical protein
VGEVEVHPARDQDVVEPQPEGTGFHDDRERVTRGVIGCECVDEACGLGREHTRLVDDRALLVDDGDDDVSLLCIQPGIVRLVRRRVRSAVD